MLKILVVDDKKLIRKGIKSFVENSDLEVGQVFECSNGKAALKLLETERMDLVITDIRMPEMDGISLMQYSNEIGHKPKFIVVSGYDDFKYAKECMNYGAKAYILKPLDRIELIETIKRVTTEIVREKEQIQREEKNNSIAERLQEVEFRLILLSDTYSEEVMKNIESEGYNFNDRGFYISLLSKRINENAEPYFGFLDLKLKIQNFFKLIPTQFVLMEMGKELLILTDNPFYITTLLASLNKEINTYYAAISDICIQCGRIREGYLQAQEALKYIYIYTDIDVILYSEIKGLKDGYKIPMESINKIGQIIGTDRIVLIDDLISEVFDRKTVTEFRIEYLEGLVTAFYEVLTGISCVQPNKWISEIEKYEVLHSIYNFCSMKEYLKALKESINSLNSYILSIKSTYREKNEIENAIEYINTNFEKNISLATVSNYVSLNYSYFSHVFKEQTGLSFVQYLRKIRVHKSMELLKDTSLKVFEIAEKIGFDNYKHFSRTFREYVGISPMEYREKSWMKNIQEDKKDIKDI